MEDQASLIEIEEYKLASRVNFDEIHIWVETMKVTE